MQLIWISGSTSSMKQIKITRKTVIKIALLSFSVFILIGMSIHFFGFRVAIRFNGTLRDWVLPVIEMLPRSSKVVMSLS